MEAKKIIITGHTGFKGSWLTAWLNDLGSDVIGISFDVPTNPSHFEILDFKNIESHQFDIRDFDVEFDDALLSQKGWINPRYEGCKINQKSFNRIHIQYVSWSFI